MVLFNQLFVGETRLRVFVQILQVRMRRRGVEVKILFLHVFAVIALLARQAKEPFFQHRVLPIPKRERKAERLMPVGNPRNAVFAPAISFGARMFVRKVTPRIAVGRIIFAHCPPRAFA